MHRLLPPGSVSPCSFPHPPAIRPVLTPHNHPPPTLRPNIHPSLLPVRSPPTRPPHPLPPSHLHAHPTNSRTSAPSSKFAGHSARSPTHPTSRSAAKPPFYLPNSFSSRPTLTARLSASETAGGATYNVCFLAHDAQCLCVVSSMPAGRVVGWRARPRAFVHGTPGAVRARAGGKRGRGEYPDLDSGLCLLVASSQIRALAPILSAAPGNLMPLTTLLAITSASPHAILTMPYPADPQL